MTGNLKFIPSYVYLILSAQLHPQAVAVISTVCCVDLTWFHFSSQHCQLQLELATSPLTPCTSTCVSSGALAIFDNVAAHFCMHRAQFEFDIDSKNVDSQVRDSPLLKNCILCAASSVYGWGFPSELLSIQSALQASEVTIIMQILPMRLQWGIATGWWQTEWQR